jgi:hypothetical protein
MQEERWGGGETTRTHALPAETTKSSIAAPSAGRDAGCFSVLCVFARLLCVQMKGFLVRCTIALLLLLLLLSGPHHIEQL